MFLSRFKRRKVIVHFHIFKNAGSTIDSIFHNSFPGQVYGLEGPSATSIVPGEEGVEFILKNPDLRVLTSHQLLHPLPKHKSLSIYPIFFLRHPIDRIGSIYRYERVQETSSPSSLIAKQSDLKNYILWLLDGRAGGIRNFQVRRLSYCGNSKEFQSRKLTERNLHIAKKRLKKSMFFGIVERFDASLLWMKNYLQRGFPEINFSYAIQNRSSDITDLEERIHSIKKQLGAELYERVLNLNQLDLELYNYALKLFDDRMQKIKKLQ